MTSSIKKCTICILDEVNCTVVGLHPDHLSYLNDQYSTFAPNHFFNPKFKLGSWDGKIRYFHKTGKTYVNLLDSIVPVLVDLGYSIDISDKRDTTKIFPNPITKDFFSDVLDEDRDVPWEMRPYQVDMVNALLASGGGVGIAGTGAGKTSMTAAVALVYERTIGARSIIIVPDKNLTDQTTEEYRFFGLDVGEYSGDTKDLNHQHIVSTWQALQHNPTIVQSFGVVIVDEGHGLRGNVLTKLLIDYGKNITYRFAVTGTLPKEPADAMAVRIAVGAVQFTIPAHELIEQGYLAKLHIDIMQLTEDFTEQYDQYLIDTNDEPPMTYNQFKDSYFPEWAAEKKYLQTNPKRLGWIAEYISIKRSQKQGNVLCLVNGVQFGKKLAELIPDAIFVHGKDKMVARKEIYALFKDNDNVVVIATSQIASTGLDIKRIFNLMCVDAGKSFIRIVQSIGRGLRKAKDKDSVHFTDIGSDLKYSKKHERERIKIYKEAKYPYKKRKVDYDI